ncbi:hypothetical protein COX24_02875 [bacterium (Candidatus Gribaldobacteria) CG23_combo_of_CG06-09_8_20_14_all_37_87_8]|uniref:Uncharacterized protein n=2 Tax=Candidatus Gribaldobacteria TaxID=2798536 RepID=A0A2G9ZGU5_9BACT|nr:MAG: hypothetical protein AUJ25_01620 [Parcubacteria group bacterium CG1_02_37_13]PIP31558.1 MAG: hypothetical protein COX24_02875 [bacterium (Candidatus Gribaldobacteria) CG23_combo_of_CG06-09_8_20_14_all_37_87_8]PIR90617.1 MAG: hypothetical protein COU05_00930 [bacterium (Candidatus Gribaldobacteria) CG10_big_fil_rev_8_21_14_0_10_37_21]
MQFQTKQIKQKIKKLFKALFAKIWVILIAGLLLSLILGGLLFWKFILLATTIEDDGPPAVAINRVLLNNFETNYLKAKEIFEKTKQIDYLNIFRPAYSMPAPIIEEESTTTTPEE